ncbi:MAG: hypothetical protein M3Y07_05825 [Acidobacteriota bacterium]|nr:hypothetical protein [Acidobacteriota bacterium]
MQVSAPNKLSVYGFNVLRPNIANLTDLNQGRRTPDHWFNTAAVTAPAPFTLGNAPRWLANARYAPIEQVFRRRRISAIANFCAQLRAEAFNVANSVQFGRANTTVGAADFGRVTSYAPGAGPRNINSACASISEFPSCAIACCRSM